MKESFLSQFGAILIGTFIGALAHFGNHIMKDGWPAPRQVVGFVMQLGLVALVAAVVADRMSIDSDLMRSLTASVLTVATNEVVSWARARAKNVLKAMDANNGEDS